MSLTLPETTLPDTANPAPARRVSLNARHLLGLLVPAILLFAWWLATRNRVYGLVPSPGEVVTAVANPARRAACTAEGLMASGLPNG